MKNRSLFVLLLAGTLALPAFAQDNANANATSQTQSASSTQTQAKGDTATGKEPLQPASREGFWGRVNPFARKKYVARQTEPIRDRINELDELTAANTKVIKDTDARAQQGIQ